MSNAFDWSAIDKDWEEANAQTDSTGERFPPVPDGTYTCVVDKVEFRSSKAGNPYMNWILIIEDNTEYKDRWLFKRDMLSKPENMAFLKRDLAICKVAIPSKLSDLDLTKLLDLRVRVTKKTKAGFDNLYIDRLLSSVEQQMLNEPKEYNDDDIPF